MKVDVWIVIDPKYPGRGMVSPVAPSAERAALLRSAGCEVWRAEVSIPTRLDVKPEAVVEAGASPCLYLGKNVANSRLHGCVVGETDHEVRVRWETGSEGVFRRAAFELHIGSGALKLEEP